MPKRQKRYFQLCVLSIRLGGSFQVSLRWHPVCELCARFGIPGIERLTHGPSVGRRVPCERNSMTLKVRFTTYISTEMVFFEEMLQCLQ